MASSRSHDIEQKQENMQIIPINRLNREKSFFADNQDKKMDVVTRVTTRERRKNSLF